MSAVAEERRKTNEFKNHAPFILICNGDAVIGKRGNRKENRKLFLESTWIREKVGDKRFIPIGLKVIQDKIKGVSC